MPLLSRILLSALVILASSLVVAQPASVPVPSPPQLPASSYVLMDFDSGHILVAKNADQQAAPASITKLMTSYLVFKELADGNLSLDDSTIVTEKAYRIGGSRMFIEVGKEVSIEALVRGMVIQSGNDASVALAEHIAGSEEAFAELMNHFAGQLGMNNTHFINATGMPDEEHFTTAADVAILSAALIRDYPDYYRWYSEKEFTYNDIRQHNRNTLLWRDPAVDGLKTGHTESAGYCLAASAKREGMRLVSVVMGSASEESRVAESQTLLNYGFRFFETYQLYQGNQELAQSKVWKADEDRVALGLESDLFVTIPRGRYEELDAQVELQPQLQAPINAGQIIGDLRVHLGDQLIVTRPLVALSDIPEDGFFGRTVDGVRLWFSGLFGDDD